ncbi:MAG: serine hydrolase domain-containing protein, partial [Dehalococcoidia bacterium]
MTVVARPEDARVDPEKLEAVFARARRDVDDGVLESCAVAVARDGKLAGHRWYGHAVQGGTDRAVDERTLFSIFSSTKAIVGVAVWALFEDGLLRLEERVAEIIPEFGSNEKDAVTVEQVMLHIGGFPLAPFAMPGWHSKEARLEAFGRWRLTFEPGSQFQYHATSAHWVLAEIIERRTGSDFRDYIRGRILDPMGLEDLHVGLAEEQHERIADMKYMSPPEPPPGGWGEVTPELLRNSNTSAWRTSGL